MSTYKTAHKKYYETIMADPVAREKRRRYARKFQRRLRERVRAMKYFCSRNGFSPK